MRPPFFTYRPLRLGIAILNPIVGQYGTLGFFGTSADGAQWLVSCYHVLGRVDFTPHAAGEPIFQPDDVSVPTPIAALANRADISLDCAAALLNPGVVGTNDILGLGRIDPRPLVPVAGMRVCKVGIATELTEGVIDTIAAGSVTIRPTSAYPPAYELSKVGDSGALWVEQGSLRPVAMHKQGQVFGGVALASPITEVLSALNLSI